ncbi:Hypothetical protein SMAX5B_002553 [Scophthalmus maximus]|uniref:Uncharacterized protein n=1 Tax=Scophthalmus maximus TaxID=52904 RepID=A0A2U9AX36_SCOMX|nr:Hypothetical protein SMAX5B_002553 [Scophthalmus maximus]
MIAAMCTPLLVVLSAGVLLHSVSAGGVYCARTARARAAALGLDFPGVHGAPDFPGPAHHAMHPGTMPLGPQPYENNDRVVDETESNMASYRQNQALVRPLDDRSPESPFLLRHGTNDPFQSEYTINRVLGFPRGRTDSNHKSNIEEVKHVALPTRVEAPGQSDLVNWVAQGRGESLPFVYNRHGLVVDESVPNRRGMSLSGLPLPQSRGHGTHHRGLAGFGLGRQVPVLASSLLHNEGHVGAMTNPSPAFGRGRGMGLPGHLAQSLHRNLNVKWFVQGNPVLRHLIGRKKKSHGISH